MPRRKWTGSYFKGLIEMQAKAQGEVTRCQRQFAEAQRNLAALDTLVRRNCPSLDPALIQPVRAWHRVVARRGALRDGLLAFLKARSPGTATKREMADHLEAELGLCFESPAHRQKWLHYSVGSQLQKFADAGIVKRLNPGTRGATLALWQWVPPSTGSSDLFAQARSDGIRVEFHQDECAQDLQQ